MCLNLKLFCSDCKKRKNKKHLTLFYIFAVYAIKLKLLLMQSYKGFTQNSKLL